MTASRPAACVIGYPAKHSRSPKLHGYWLKRYGIDGTYRAEEITPEAFPEFVERLSEHGYVGANVTMPHKDAALELSAPDERAIAVGAAISMVFAALVIAVPANEVAARNATLCDPVW